MDEREKRNTKIIFLVFSPFMFLGLFRLFFLFFFFVYGMTFLWVAGAEYSRTILVLATATSAFFAGATVVILYRQFKRHILGEPDGKGELL